MFVWFCAQNRTRTCTSLNTRTWNERVYHSATWAYTDKSVVDTNSNLLERKTRLELATLTLARLCSTNWAISAICLLSYIISKSNRCHFRFASAKVLLFFNSPNFSVKKNVFFFVFFIFLLLSIADNTLKCGSWHLMHRPYVQCRACFPFVCFYYKNI